MAPPRYIPSDSILANWRDEGLTASQMAARIKEQSGVDVATGSVYAALSRAGLTNQLRYDEWIPWSPIRADHVNAYPLLMLRLAARREAGHDLTELQNKKLDSWIDRLQDEGVVVHYEHDTADGWFYVPTREGIDTGLIRCIRPGGVATAV